MAIGRRRSRNSTKRRILWVEPVRLDIDLYKSSVLEILNHLTKKGHSVSLIAMRSKNLFRTKTSVRVVSIPLRDKPAISHVLFALFLLFSLPYYIITLKPDFIIATPNASVLGIIPGLLILRLKKIKVILDVRTTPVEIKGFRGSIQRFWFLVSVLSAKKLFNGITIITPLMRKEVCKQFGIDEGKIGVWADGVDEKLFDPEKYITESAELRTRLGLSEKFVVLYHGVFSATRGLSETVKAIKLLRPKHSNIVFFLLGTGSTVSALRELIQEQGLQESVLIHGPVDQTEVPKFISMCDLGIVPLPYSPYWRYQCPLKLLEYLAMQKVVIATDIPAHRSIIGDAKCAIYISSIEPEEIAKSIEFAYLKKEKLVEWGKLGRPIIKKKYAWETVAEGLESYLLSIDNRS